MPYASYNNFDQTYFEGTSVASPHEAGYSDYDRHLLPFPDYAQKIRDEVQALGQDPTTVKLLIVGCAYGYTLEYLIDDYNIEAYGMDISTYAVNQADTEIAYGGRIYQGDVLSSQDLKSVRQSSQGGRFDIILNECVLTCLTDSEAQTACNNMRSEAQDTLMHRVWSTDGSDLEADLTTDWYNSHTMDEWRTLCDPNDQDVWYTEREFQP